MQFEGRALGQFRVELGSTAYDPLTILITRTPSDSASSDLELARTLETDAQGLPPLDQPRFLKRGEQSWVAARYRRTHEPDLVSDSVIAFREGGRWKVVVTSWKALAVAPERVAERVLNSIVQE